jgi:hypothetical protein
MVLGRRQSTLIAAFVHNSNRLPEGRWSALVVAGILNLAGLATIPAASWAQTASDDLPLIGSSDRWADALVTDRPDFTESPVSVVSGRIQLEGGYTFSRLEDERSHTVGELLARIGAVDRLEFRVGINSFVFRSEPGPGDASSAQLRSVRGLEDLTLGLKVELVRAQPSKPGIPQIALLAGTTIPTGRSEIGSDGLTPGALVSAGWEIADWLSGGLNLGYANPADPLGRYDELSGSIAFGFGLTDRLGAFAEWFGIYPLPSEREAENNADVGVTYMLSPDFQLDFRIGAGLDGPHPDFFLGTGAAWRI